MMSPLRIIGLFLLVLPGCIFSLQAQTITAVSDGNWNAAATWSESRSPGDDDIILIPAGRTVTVMGTDHVLDEAILVIEGNLIMESTCGFCANYGSLTFTGPNSGVVIEPGAQVIDGTWFGGDSHFINVQGETFWSGDDCNTNCGTYQGNQAPTEKVAGPSTLENPLPVELSSFTARLKEGQVQLNWTTATELNNDYFVLERSLDGHTFDPLETIAGQGTISEPTQYAYTDSRVPYQLNQLIYYRLKQVDYDGTTTYPGLVVVKNNLLNIGKVWPTQFQDVFYVAAESRQEERLTLQLFNQQGQQVLQRSYTLAEGVHQLEVNGLRNLQPGLYYLHLQHAKGIIKKRLMKTK